MLTISRRELRGQLDEVLRRVEAGETITVTRKGRPVVRLIAAQLTVLEELEVLGQVRPAQRPFADLTDLKPAKLPDGVTSADIIADVRGYERGY